ncbi:unnamed protein product [Gordionus sp. m RMFG-2023]|uniref:uncharacterized protein LOC135929689 isoform X1 n=1 Tax=Gordionus sp. m RMFG-2023 TaxID=3053472 RepID=UPI0030DFB9A1
MFELLYNATVEDYLCLFITLLIILLLRFAWKSTFVAVRIPQSYVPHEISGEIPSTSSLNSENIYEYSCHNKNDYYITQNNKDTNINRKDIPKYSIPLFLKFYDDSSEKVYVDSDETVSHFQNHYFSHQLNQCYTVKLIFHGQILNPSIRFAEINKLDSESVLQCHLLPKEASNDLLSNEEISDIENGADETVKDIVLPYLSSQKSSFFHGYHHPIFSSLAQRHKNLVALIYDTGKKNVWFIIVLWVLILAWFLNFLYLRYVSSIFTLSLVSVTVITLFLLIITVLEPST